MNSKTVLDIFKKCGGYITDSHIVYTSGKHGSVYLNKDAIYPHTKEISAICLSIAKKYKNSKIEAVSSPALGGIILSQWTAYHLSKLTNNDVLAVYTEKDYDKNQIFTRGYDKLVAGKKVLVVEDVTTTGGSVLKTLHSVIEAGGKIIGISILVNRDPKNINSKSLGFPYSALVEMEVDAWEEKDCPLCKKGVMINTAVGHGKKYLEEKSKNNAKDKI